MPLRPPSRPRRVAVTVLACMAGVTSLVGAAPQEDPLKPHPAQMAELADESILVDMDRAGDTLVAVGARGHILTSTDGINWTQRPAPVDTMLNRVQFYDDRIGWAGGHDGVILRTADGGETWQLQQFKPAPEQAVYDFHFIDADRGFAVGAYDLFLRTDDAGQTWSRVDSPVGEGGLHHYSITELADGTLLIAGERSMLARSTDGGDTWERVATPYFGSYFGAVPVGDTGAIVFGLRGNVYRIDNIAALPTVGQNEYGEYELGELPDGAAVQLTAPTGDSLFNGIELADGGAILVGVNGAVLRYKPGSTILTAAGADASSPIGDAALIGDRMVIAGESGVSSLPAPR